MIHLLILNDVYLMLFCDDSYFPGFPAVPVERLCQHSGICIDAGNTHHCQCPLGYTGSYCEKQLDECVSNPCQHGATCIDFLGGYRCEVRMNEHRSESAQEVVWLL